MNCNRVQILISAFIDNELDPQEKRDLRRHLFCCSDCHSEYQNFLKLKDFLNNLNQERSDFDPLVGFKLRLAEAEHSFFPATNHLFMLGRLSFITSCVTLFFLSTVALFPNDSSNRRLAQYSGSESKLAPASISISTNQIEDPIVRNFSLDEPVTVFQASSILP